MTKYNPFECCHVCVPPKRKPGCHDRCPDFAEAWILFEAKKAMLEAEKQANEYTTMAIVRSKNSAAKKRAKWQKYNHEN